MKLYADRPAHATNQALGDVLVLAWIALWAWLGHALHDLVLGLAVPGQKAEEAGRSLQHGLQDAGSSLGDVPFAGDKLREPFDRAAASGGDLADAAQSYQDAVGRLAVLAGILLAVAPIIVVLGLWLPRRVAWVLAASAASRLMKTETGADDLFALRALAARPLPELARTSRRVGGLVEGWRARDPEVVQTLAQLELDDLGLRRKVPAQ
ncbi:MAG: hypothetical protein QOJ90_1023 [Actinomycetota bacterium]|nr:hypothetical protein [Actinomycetota bacterium]